MKLSIYILSLTLLAAGSSAARDNANLKKAEYLYDHMAYAQALKYYGQLQPVPANPRILGHMADCYTLTKNNTAALACYARAASLPSCSDTVRLNYAKLLITIGADSIAISMLEVYLEHHPGDHRAMNMKTSCTFKDSLLKLPPTGYLKLLPFNTDASEFGPSMRKQELFFTSDRLGHSTGKQDKQTGESYYSLYRTADHMTGSFDMESELPGKTNGRYHDGPCTFDESGNMYFTRTNSDDHLLTTHVKRDAVNVARLEIFIATDYDPTMHKYGSIKPFAYNNSNYSVTHPAISSDGSKLFFVSDMPGGVGGTDIYMCERMPGGAWATPQNLGPGINTEGNEQFPFADVDNTLYFASDGLIGYGGSDLYKCSYDKAIHRYKSPINMGMPVNSPYDDFSITMATDGLQAYFASDRPAEKKGDNIYSFSPRPINLVLSGTDSITAQPINNFTITSLTEYGNHEQVMSSNSVIHLQLYPGVNYTWRITSIGHQPRYLYIPANFSPASDSTVINLKFDPRTDIKMRLAVYDEVTDTTVTDCHILCYKAGQPQPERLELSKDGLYRGILEGNNTYRLIAVKDNYNGKEITVSTSGISPEQGEVIISRDLYLKQPKSNQ